VTYLVPFEPPHSGSADWAVGGLHRVVYEVEDSEAEDEADPAPVFDGAHGSPAVRAAFHDGGRVACFIKNFQFMERMWRAGAVLFSRQILMRTLPGLSGNWLSRTRAAGM